MLGVTTISPCLSCLSVLSLDDHEATTLRRNAFSETKKKYFLLFFFSLLASGVICSCPFRSTATAFTFRACISRRLLHYYCYLTQLVFFFSALNQVTAVR